LQALLTSGFLGIERLSKGCLWEHQAKLLVILAIAATWCFALRTIRARIVELLRFLRAAVGRAAPQMGLGAQAEYVRKTTFCLRVIAAGITMPFFLLPLFVSALCLAVCWHQRIPDGHLLALAALLSVVAVIVGAYFRWAIVPAHAPRRPANRRARR